MRGDAARSHSTMAERIAVIGAGQMGNGIAHVFAQSGFEVAMIDVAESALAKGRETIVKNLDRQIKRGSITEEDKTDVLGRLTTATSMDGLKGAVLVVEAASGRRDLKFKIFSDIDGLADQGAILARNTS